MKQAKNLGSVMKLNVSEEARTYIKQRFTALEHTDYRDFQLEAIYQNLKPYIPVLLILTKKYSSVVANPPYMGQKNMNADLKNYVNTNYPSSKSDLMTVFMAVGNDMVKSNGCVGMLNLPSWMFLSSFESYRKKIIEECSIRSLIHLGRGVFGSDFGTVTFILDKCKSSKPGNYRRLFKKHVTVDSVDLKEKRFLDKNFGNYRVSQTNFSKIPGSPIGYWLSDKFFEVFKNNKRIADYTYTAEGIKSGNNELFLRNWYEINSNDISQISNAEYVNKKWDIHHKGGEYCKWYGNLNYVIFLGE